MRNADQLTAATASPPASDALAEARATAKAAGLIYASDTTPGIRRQRRGKGWAYFDADGKRIAERDEIDRLNKLAIPPAWTQVWICPSPRGHIQATGRDARGRKQYRYHEEWRQTRDATKFERILEFAANLPALRERVLADLRKHGLPREKVLATIVYLLENTLVRVGNEEYARANKSYGLTTLRDRHVEISGSTLRFEFLGKSGKVWKVKLTDRRVAKIVRSCQELPGQNLFQYIDENGEQQKVTSADLNAYLRDISGQDITAKDFRTWAGTVLAANALKHIEQQAVQTAEAAQQALAEPSATSLKRNLNLAIKGVAAMLGNTPAICRKCYIHAEIMTCYTEGVLIGELQRHGKRLGRSKNGGDLARLRPDEAVVLSLLRARLDGDRRKAA
jgi:DNA topoisomerase-1